MNQIGWTFSYNTFDNSIFIGKHVGSVSPFCYQACYSNYPSSYKSKKNFYISIEYGDTFPEVIELFNQTFPSFKVTITNLLFVDKIEEESHGWKCTKHLLFDKKSRNTQYNNYIIKVDVSDQYNVLARYVVMYYIALIMRLYHKPERFVEAVPKLGDEDLITYYTRMNNTLIDGWSGYHINTNHNISWLEIKPTLFTNLNDVEKMNKLCEEPFDIPHQKCYSHCATHVELNCSISQTNLSKVIEEL